MSSKPGRWTVAQIPEQRGRVALITGASSGIGEAVARVLAQKHAGVILAVRNTAKGNAVAASIRQQCPGAEVTVCELELASLQSVNAFADAIVRDHSRLDILINNAGVMICPYGKTEDGFETQFGTNHLGHFALTLRLLPLLQQTPGARVVSVSSLAHRRGRLDFADLNWTARKYSAAQAYSDSKLANLYFTYELARRLQTVGNTPLATAAHPGWTTTELQRHMGRFKFVNNVFGQDVATGALPILRAAVDPTASPGDYFGPDRYFELNGHPVKVTSNARSHDVHAARELWRKSEELTGVLHYAP